MKNVLSTVVLVILTIVVVSAVNIFLGIVGLRMSSPAMVERNGYLPPYSLTQDLKPRLYDPAVRLEDPKHGFFCSGTVISDDYVLTAAHCVVNYSPFEGHVGIRKKELNVKGMSLTVLPDLTVSATAAAINNRADYALVKGDFSEFSKARLLTDHRELLPLLLSGVPLVTCGFPWGAGFACYPISGLSIYYEHIQGAGLMYPGMSGGLAAAVLPDGPVVFAVNTAVGNGFVVISTTTGLFESLGVEVSP